MEYLESFTKLSKAIAGTLLGGFLLQLAIPVSKQYLALVPGRTLPFIYTVLTSHLLEDQFVSVSHSVCQTDPWPFGLLRSCCSLYPLSTQPAFLSSAASPTVRLQYLTYPHSLPHCPSPAGNSLCCGRALPAAHYRAHLWLSRGPPAAAVCADSHRRDHLPARLPSLPQHPNCQGRLPAVSFVADIIR